MRNTTQLGQPAVDGLTRFLQSANLQIAYAGPTNSIKNLGGKMHNIYTAGIPRRLAAALVLVVLAGSLFALSARSDAADAWFCGSPSSPRYISYNSTCVSSIYRANPTAVTVIRDSATRTACPAVSRTADVLTAPYWACTGTGITNVWTCPYASCPGWPAMFTDDSTWGTMHGWYSYL